jgi:hypothetical protein
MRIVAVDWSGKLKRAEEFLCSRRFAAGGSSICGTGCHAAHSWRG